MVQSSILCLTLSAPTPSNWGGQILRFSENFDFVASSCGENSAPFRPFIAPNGSTHDYSILPQTGRERPHQPPVTSKNTSQGLGPRGGLGPRALGECFQSFMPSPWPTWGHGDGTWGQNTSTWRQETFIRWKYRDPQVEARDLRQKWF